MGPYSVEGVAAAAPAAGTTPAAGATAPASLPGAAQPTAAVDNQASSSARGACPLASSGPTMEEAAAVAALDVAAVAA